VSGSTKICSNEAILTNRDPSKDFSLESSPNFVLCAEMVEWNLQERGVLRVDNVRHYKKDEQWVPGTPNPENYKRLVDIEYYIDIFERKDGQWVPYVASDI